MNFRTIAIAIILLVSSLIPICAASQEVHEIGLSAGATSYLGDFNTIKILKNPLFGIGALYRYNVSEYTAVRLALNYGQISGKASDTKNYLPNIPYDYEFQESYFNADLKCEVNFLPFDPLKRKGKNFSPYLFAGIGGYVYNGEIVPAIPFGLGVKYSPADRWSVGAELQLAKTFTDELDSYSNLTSQKSALINNDWFVFCGLVVSYRLKIGQKTCPVYL